MNSVTMRMLIEFDGDDEAIDVVRIVKHNFHL